MATQLSDKLNFVKYQSAGSNYSMPVQAGNCRRWKHCDSTELDGLTNEGRQKRPNLHTAGERNMRSLISKTALVVLCLSAQLPAAFAGPQDPPGKFGISRPSVERPGRPHDRMTGQTKVGLLSTEANSLPSYLATLRRLHATDGHIEPQD